MDFTLRFRLPAASGRANMIEGDGTSSETDEREGERGQAQRKFITPVAREAVGKMHLGDSDAHIDTNCQRGDAGK